VPLLSDGYHVARQRLSELVRGLDEGDLHRPVPACAAWEVRDVVAYLCGVAEAVAAGSSPVDAHSAWSAEVVADRRAVAVEELLDRWAACADELSARIDDGGEHLLPEVIGYEHDVRAAVGRPGARGAPEVRASIPISLQERAEAIKAAGLGALVVDSGVVRWTSHFARPGWTMQVDPWEAHRALFRRRTAAEMRAYPGFGDPEPYLALIAGRLRLPETSLGET
jgi:hypothetical protein